MNWMIGVVAFLLVAGSLLSMAEVAITRMSRVRAMALREEGRRNASTLERIEEYPPRYLNSIYLALMFTQNGSAIIVAIMADRAFGQLGITLMSVAFTLLYFVLVEAMSKTFGIQHSDGAALALAPLATGLARVLSLPTRALIGLSNVLLPGRGLKAGPFVSEEEIRQMAEVGHEEGVIEEGEKELIHSIFEFGDTVVREIMTPRPDMMVVEAERTVREALDVTMRHGFSRVPVIGKDSDDVKGVVYAKDLFRAMGTEGNGHAKVGSLVREAYFVPESMRVSDLLREMQQRKVHMAIVADEYGDVAGLVTMEDILEEIVGEIADEYDIEESMILPIGQNGWRVQAKMPIWEFNELVEGKLPEKEEWQTIGGLVASALGKIPEAGDEVLYQGFRFRVERVQRRRIGTVLVQKAPQDVENGGAG